MLFRSHDPDHPSLAAWLRLNGREIDHVLLCRPDVARDCLRDLRAHTHARIAYYGHDLHFRRLRLQGERLRQERTLREADRRLYQAKSAGRNCVV